MPNHELGFAVIDFETTGLFPARGDRIVEVAVVQLTLDGDISDEWTSLVNPGRSVSATRIHGLTDADVRRAPNFGSIVGELNARLSGRVLVAHNAPFELAFLELEYARAGWCMPSMPHLCTLQASHHYLPGIARRRLQACCAAVGITIEAAHTAIGDAKGAAALLRHYIKATGAQSARSEHLALPHLAAKVAWPTIPRCTGLEVLRPTNAPRDVIPAAPGTLSRLLDELPSSAMAEAGAAFEASGYMELLAEVLEDGVLTDAEVNGLIEFAGRYSLTRPQVQAAHRSFLSALAQRAIEDGKVTRDERREIVAVAELLGLGAEVPKKILLEARAAVAERLGATSQQLPETWELGNPLRVGDGVAFTGCDDLERAQLEGRAQAAGLRVTGAVSRKTAILVTDGADNTTSKARRAQELGTRIVTPEAFAVMVEYVQPADA